MSLLPSGYVALNGCALCGRDFTGIAYFDRHRVGRHAYTLAEGLRMDPPREGGRHCLADDELLATGLRPIGEDEMRESKYANRIGSGVPLWHDPVQAEATRT